MRWTTVEVRRMVEAGVIADPNRFELVDGLILEKMSQDEPHALALSLTARALATVFAGQADVERGVPLYLSDTSEPEPDVMVVTPGLRRVFRAGDVRLVIEIANTSLLKDQTLKASLYARHDVPEYVIVDVANRRVEIRRRPQGEEWGETTILDERGEFTPPGASGPVRVADLLPDSEVS